MFVHTLGGNFLPTEAQLTPEGLAYRKKVKQWARTYALAAKTFNTGKSFNKYLPSFSKNLPVSDFLNEGITIREDQYKPIWAAINLGRSALFLGMGRGKTFIGGYIATYLQRYGKLAEQFPNNKALVVCPKSALDEWAKQLPAFFDCTVSVFPENPAADTDIVVTNYEQAHKLVSRRKEFGILLCDESQQAKNVATKTFTTIAEFCDAHLWHRFVLTGTPILNQPDDLFTQASLINPYSFDCSYSFMRDTYYKKYWVKGKGAGKGFPKETFDKRYIAHVQKIMEQSGFILPDTGEDIETEETMVKCTASPKQKELLYKLAQGYIQLSTASQLGAPNEKQTYQLHELKNIAGKELQVSSGFLKVGEELTEFPSDKLTKAVELVKKYPDEQFIIWTFFRHTSRRLHYALPESGLVYGGMANKQRNKTIKAFKDGKIKRLVMQITSGNSALNLQNCRNNIFVEYVYSAAVMRQAKARTARSGQTRLVRHWFLYTGGTADVLQLSIIKNKKKVTASIMRTYLQKQLTKLRKGA